MQHSTQKRLGCWRVTKCNRLHADVESSYSSKRLCQAHQPLHAPQAKALSRRTQIIEYTTIPILAVALVAAFVALAALTGCFGAKQAAARAAAAAKPGTPTAKGGAYAASGPIPINVTSR